MSKLFQGREFVHAARTGILLVALTSILLLTACGRSATPEPSAVEEPDASEQESSSENAAGAAPQANGVREDGVFRIVATTTQAADLTNILVAGVEQIEITPLMGAGVDPHLYQPTESDVAAMNEADMVIYSGLHLEGQFDAVFEALNEQGVLIYALSKPVRDGGFTIGGFTLSEELVDVDDPHFWFDPRNWDLTTADLAAQLAEIDPESQHTTG